MQSAEDNAARSEVVERFIQRWQGVTGSERANYQLFIADLCDVIGVPPPDPASEDTRDNSYVFERRISFSHGDGSASNGFIDCYRRGSFVLEAKRIKRAVDTQGFDDALMRARAQGEGYARALPASEGRPPFVAVVDVGHVIELYSEFTRTGATYTPFPDPRSHRITLEDLRQPRIRDRLKSLWLSPMDLDPARISAKVTRDVAVQLAAVARSLELDGHTPHDVASFLTRCLFSMFAEDVGLLPRASNGEGAFADLLTRYAEDPTTLRQMMASLWSEMDRGGFSATLAKSVMRFNGKLFKNPTSDSYVLPLSRDQVYGLRAAATADWKEVEPAIFGTLLERALNPAERHSLGAHFTPRAYVERLVQPTIVMPLRDDWVNAQAAALLRATEANSLEGKKRQDKLSEARQELLNFHHRLCTVKILDPACGSGNFLYVALEHLKRLEGEVISQLGALGDTQEKLILEGETVTLQQLRGIEVNDRAAALAELVLWIGYLQWHIRTFGKSNLAEPVIHDYGNIEHRDAVLSYDSTEPIHDADGAPLSRWDGVRLKSHPVTSKLVPDEASRVPVLRYLNPQPSKWPQADFIVGNPPFIGAGAMRATLGDGYVQALRGAWDSVPESADFVMYWWNCAAMALKCGNTRRFGFITTNSVRQTFNRRIIEKYLNDEPRVNLAFAIPDHPWVDNADGAAVRIAMTVGTLSAGDGRLLTVTDEVPLEDGEISVTMSEMRGNIHADLRIGANVADATTLHSNSGLSSRGVQLFGAGFILSRADAAALGYGTLPNVSKFIREYRNGRDLTDRPRDVLVIDTFGTSADDLRSQAPTIYQRLQDHVKPERDQNNRASYRNNWWIFGEPRKELRRMLTGLPRYIATVETAKHRTFQFLDATVMPDNKLVAIATDDALHLGVLSSSIHNAWALAAGGWLGVGNDPVYVKSKCFETFPFPDIATGLTDEIASTIRRLAESLDAHRKLQQQRHSELTLTGLYNVLVKLRDGEPLNPKEQVIHKIGLVSVLKSLHDDLDIAVLRAYGWDDHTHPYSAETILEKLLALNKARAQREAEGKISWLRPLYQNTIVKSDDLFEGEIPKVHLPAAGKIGVTAAKSPWPAGLPDQIKRIATLLGAVSRPINVNDIADSFAGRGRWRERIPVILETLEAIGRARRLPDNYWSDSRIRHR